MYSFAVSCLSAFPACVCMFVHTVIKNTIVSGSQAMNVYERQLMSSVRETFVVFVLVFYLW